MKPLTESKKGNINMFSLYVYIKPQWYFNLNPVVEDTLSPLDVDINKLEQQARQEPIFAETQFQSEYAGSLDKSFQAWHKGFFVPVNNKQLERESTSDISLIDNYRFIRKYHSPKWVYYVLLRRLLALKNPISEIIAFLKTRDTRRVKLYERTKDWSLYNTFHSSVIEQNPMVSIVIPTLNRYIYLKDVLADLEKQDYKNFEVIVVDQSEPFNEDFYRQFNLSINLIHQKEKALWKARNEAIRASKGELLLFFDDDSRVEPDWISHHIKALDFFKADISAGVSISKVGARVPDDYYHFRWADQFDSGNALVKKEVFRKIGLFDRQFDGMRMGDGEFGLRAYLNGFKSVSNPLAKRLHLKVSEGGLRQMGSWDSFRPKKMFAPKPVPSVIYLYSKYYPKNYVREAVIIGILPSLVPYKYKSNRVLTLLGLFAMLLLSPVILTQVYKSWRIANRMLKQGSKIESL
jgi:glycosyltransferase involved in cell wall biosynthesis